MSRKLQKNSTTFFLFCTLLLFLGAEVILNLTPPISRDALIHHLTIPKLWLKHGGFYEIPWADFAYYPMNIDLFFLVCLYFKNDIAPKFIHMAFGTGIGLLVYIYLKKRMGHNWGLLGAVIFITTPIVVWLSTSAYVDLGMTFFTTGSVLAFIKWRDSKYEQFKWLLISSCCMGIAIGSKYNALIAWFIMTLMLMFSYARDNNKQFAALQYGIIFVVVAVMVASPWYLKNYLQTGNPFYPLFNSFFISLQQHPAQEILYRQAIEKTGQVSFFKLREVMYGETFLETLLIPIRMFFQGEDNSYRYFQGILNPILIVFSPFILLEKKYKQDKLLFAFFSVLFVFMGYFLTKKQVRYLLPVLPFLSILSVMGIKGMVDKIEVGNFYLFLPHKKNVKSIARIFIFSAVGILIFFNFLYLKNRMDIIKPFPYLFGQETKKAFLRRHLLHYDAVDFINTELPADSKIFTMFLGRRGYYLDRGFSNEPSFGMNTLRQMIKNASDEEKFKAHLRSMNVTHILMRPDLVSNFMRNNFNIQEIQDFMNMTKKYWKPVYDRNGYVVWEIQLVLRGN